MLELTPYTFDFGKSREDYRACKKRLDAEYSVCKKVEKKLQRTHKLRKNISITALDAKNIVNDVCYLLHIGRARIRVCDDDRMCSTSSYQRMCGIGIIVFVKHQLNVHTALHELAHHVCAEEKWDAHSVLVTRCVTRSEHSKMHGDAFCEALEFVYLAHAEAHSEANDC